jgi:hypothetical protein
MDERLSCLRRLFGFECFLLNKVLVIFHRLQRLFLFKSNRGFVDVIESRFSVDVDAVFLKCHVYVDHLSILVPFKVTVTYIYFDLLSLSFENES